MITITQSIRDHYDNKDYETVIKNCNQLLQNYKSNVEAYLYRGISYFHIANTLEEKSLAHFYLKCAIADLDRYIAIDDENESAYLFSGLADYLLNNFAYALSKFKAAQQLLYINDHSDDSIEIYIAMTQLRLSVDDKSMLVLQRAFENPVVNLKLLTQAAYLAAALGLSNLTKVAKKKLSVLVEKQTDADVCNTWQKFLSELEKNKLTYLKYLSLFTSQITIAPDVSFAFESEHSKLKK